MTRVIIQKIRNFHNKQNLNFDNFDFATNHPLVASITVPARP